MDIALLETESMTSILTLNGVNLGEKRVIFMFFNKINGLILKKKILRYNKTITRRCYQTISYVSWVLSQHGAL